ncbi:MAG: hypothetical protein B6I35_06130 [Anaerolineaceae bacterium 4572_32.2]|nr:MAG: hypothetical protein B6I35_06130 [Anaerolineaceae bacterium 4572_32.2]
MAGFSIICWCVKGVIRLATMTMPLLTTKLYIPPPRPNLVSRPRLIKRLNAGLHRKLTLISAPAGFGKTTLLSEWANGHLVVWLSLDEGDDDPARLLAYLVAALQTGEPDIGAGVLTALQSPQPPPFRRDSAVGSTRCWAAICNHRTKSKKANTLARSGTQLYLSSLTPPRPRR